MRSRFHLLSIICVGLAVLCSRAELAYAQAATATGGLTITGSKEVVLKPSRLRLSMSVQAEGRDAKEAIKSLADHKAKVTDALKEMKADMASLQFEASKVTEQLAGMQQDPSSQRMFVPQPRVEPFGAGNGEESDDKPVKIFTARASMTVDWAIPTEDIDALSLLPEALKAQISERDLIGKKNRIELSEEEQEFATEYVRRIQQSGGYYTSNNAATPELQISYVASITPEQEKEALRAAYEDAVANAAILAEATGQKLGKIRSISRYEGNADPNVNAYEYDQFGNAVRRAPMRKSAREVTSNTASRVTKTFGVTLIFMID
jgi:uncharacterized protein YggE